MSARLDQLDLRPSVGLAARVAASAQVTTSRMSPDIDEWLAAKRRQPFENTLIPLDELTEPGGWLFAPGTGNLEHYSGRFFSVEGLHVRANHGRVREWSQPILVQRDIAILGIIAKEFDGVLHFLLQAKMEPGNLGLVQLSPTVQATSSNYTQVHRGRRAAYVEYFTEPGRGRVVVDILQSEQGAWFHLKRNRNVVVEVTEDVPEHEDFCWLTLGQIRRLLRQPNVINMDARTALGFLPFTGPDGGEVLGAAPWEVGDPAGLHSMTEILSWFTGRKSEYELATRLVPLDSVTGWHRDAYRISPRHEGVHGGNFSIVGVRVHADTREVHSWKQPLLAPHGLGLAGLVVRRIRGRLHALVRAEALPGYRDTVEIGPTVRFMMTDYPGTPPDHRPEYLDYLLSAPEGVVRYDVVQSEEGGRFHHAETRYLVVEAGEEFPLQVPPDFAWITVEQLLALQRHSYYLGIEARTLLLCLNSL
ncbi:NDP-hexose 2,3-dehydratase [Sphaerisporangium melleum]|uniref:NDP-hexose 2,3-dehydratase n=1 Tax=Sphaerisporangium melleum TaxID=321316 RepID=A0A917QYD5_9ACTN|nr:NDP-hexose 2,3-dehydratase family protein [Sphaerisporangium melleum]GGK75001.1 NDP-hexose 2,3-dehydratase [Sphaerisporangium melleum]GII70987.1 NDP-hexose 2,3-dehydratase [Sphaerisporangium melleum]